MKESIDFVVTWVDCCDPAWQKTYKDFTDRDVVSETNRFRDWGFLRYWFRAVERYAPWVGNVYFITNGQKPDFLNLNHPKLKFVSHREYINEKYLPTFNSNVIEMNLMNIPDLSEHFVLFNDDIFLNVPVKEEDFFVNGLPCDSAVLDMIIPLGENDVFYHTLLNDVDVINKHYDKKRVVGANKGAWYSIKYGKELMRNICLSPWRHFGGFKDYHLVNSFLKSSFSNMYEKESNAFERTYQNHFRSWDDITQHLIRDYQLCEGKFYPRKKKGRFFEIGKHTENIAKAISEEKYAYICLNDDTEAVDFEENKRIIIEAFEKKYPQKSSFEI